MTEFLTPVDTVTSSLADYYANIGAIVKFLGAAVAVLTLSKAAWSVAAFFISMSATLKSLSVSVERLTVRFDAHYEDVHSGLSDVRERLTALETWRDIQ